MKSKINKNKLFIIFLTIALIFLPNTLTLAPQTSQIAIVTAMGIDSSLEGIEVSAQIITPKFESGFSKNLEVVSASGKNLSDAVSTMAINLGKKIGLAHLGIIIVADNLSQNQNIASLLSPLLKSGDKNTNAVLISTPSVAKEVLKLGSSLDNNFNFSLNSITQYSSHLLLNGQSKLQNFFINYKNNASAVFLGVISLEELNGEGLMDDESSETSTTSNKMLLNDGSMAIFKEGKKVAKITKQEFENFSLFMSGEKDLSFTIDNISDEVYENEQVNITLTKNKAKYKTYFYNGIPRVYLTNNLTIKLERKELDNDNKKAILTPLLRQKIISQIKLKMASAFNFLKENNADVFNFYELFYAFNNAEFKAYLNNNSEQHYLDKLELFAHFNLTHKT